MVVCVFAYRFKTRCLTPVSCCTMVGLVENALMEIKETMNPDRIIIESRCVYIRARAEPQWISFSRDARLADQGD